jgi:uncharacterized RDD family membrane protein YckC
VTQPPPNLTPPAGGPPPAAGGVVPPSGPTPQGYAVPAQPRPAAPPPGWLLPPPGYAGHTPPPGWVLPPGHTPPPGWAGPPRPGFTPPPLGPGGQPLASFGDRLLALLIDAAVLTAVSMIFIIPGMIIFLMAVIPDLTATNPDGTLRPPDFLADFFVPFLVLEAGVILLSLILTYVLHVEMMFRTGQTVGKRMMNLRIVPLDPTGTLGRRGAVKRFLAQNVVALLIPGFSYVDGLWQLWDKPWQQCLHDKFAGTVVVKVSG